MGPPKICNEKTPERSVFLLSNLIIHNRVRRYTILPPTMQAGDGNPDPPHAYAAGANQRLPAGLYIITNRKLGFVLDLGKGIKLNSSSLAEAMTSRLIEPP